MPRTHLVVDRFAPEGRVLRRTFDERFADPRAARGDRFVWDYWHVPGQYTALRTPAWTYFPKRVYEAFHRRLVAWGRSTLGCHDISPPWLSCYVEGCGQKLHGDLPHGPWAFVYSLTNWRGRAFTGGETVILRDEVLDFWSDFTSVRSVEEPHVLTSIEPKFDRLVVFDPRVPHGVRDVRGTHDPREGRLVIHGWFVQPRPFIQGPLPVASLGGKIDELSGALASYFDEAPAAIAGMFALGFAVTAAGAARDVRILSDTTRTPAPFEPARRELVSTVRKVVASWRFPKQRAASRVTLPIVFESS